MYEPAYRLREATTAILNLRSLISSLNEEQLQEAEKLFSNALMSVTLETFHREKENLERREVAAV